MLAVLGLFSLVHDKKIFADCSAMVSADYLDALSGGQREALRNLCVYAGIILDEDFDPQKALELVNLTQKRFVNRGGNKERWEASCPEWLGRNSERILQYIKCLNMCDPVLPKEEEYDAICILGAAAPTMQNRIDFISEQLRCGNIRTKNIFLLTGERYVTDKIDGTPRFLGDIAEHFGVPLSRLTEAHVFKYQYEKSYLNGKYNCIVIDTPARNGSRPTTQTTVEDFLKWKNNNSDAAINKILFISSQPSVRYQEEIIKAIFFSQKQPFDCIEVVGGNGWQKQNLQRLVGGVGECIWAVMPRIFREMNVKIDQKNLELINKLYGRMPLLYSMFPLENRV